MKPSRSSRFLLAVLAAALVSAIAAPIASASIFTDVENKDITTTTNPGDPGDWTVVWREGWGNDPLAKFFVKIPQPTADEPAIVGAYYFLTRPGTVTDYPVDVNRWDNCYMAWVSHPSLWTVTMDLVAEDGNPGPLFTNVPSIPGAVRSYEGPFSWQFQFFAKDVTTAADGSASFGLDVTPPVKVTGLRAVPGMNDPIQSGILKQSRIVFEWDDKVYDTLSGTGYFELYMDGKPYPASAESKVSRRVYDLKEHYAGYGFSVNTKREMTVEDLPAGKHVFQVRAVDRATNAGPLSDGVTLQIDPDFPEIKVTWPYVSGQVIGVKPTFQAAVTDKGGVENVKFYVDGIYVGTDDTAPYAQSADLSAFANNSHHILRVVAEDVAGRTNYADMEFVVDKVAPVLKSVSGAPNPFYPVITDGYKDYFFMKFNSSEPGTAKVVIKKGDSVYRTWTRTVRIGDNTFFWNGKGVDGTAVAGRYTWTVYVYDQAKNRASTGARYVTIRDYEIVKNADGSVTIVPR